MVGGLKRWRSTRPAAESLLVIPGDSEESGWVGYTTRDGRLGPSRALSGLQAVPGRSRLALPTSEVFCLALWLQEVDASKFPAMIALQLELRGLKVADSGSLPNYYWSIIESETQRTLVLVGLLPGQLSAELSLEKFESFEVAARLRPYEDDSMTLWRERGRICLACTRGRELVHFQALTELEIGDALIRDLDCILTALKLQDLVPKLNSLVLWLEATPTQRQALGEALRLKVRPGPSPAWQLPARSWDLQPAQWVDARRRLQQQRWQRRLLWSLGILYALVVAIYLIQALVTWGQIQAMRGWLSAHEEVLRPARQARLSWQFLAPLVETTHYPLENLLQAATLLPPGAHLTLFEQTELRLRLHVEARGAAQAFAYLDRLKHDSSLGVYQWTMPPPKLLANDQAELQIEGTRAGAN